MPLLHEPTDEQRKLVRHLAILGVRHDDIAKVVGIGDAALRRHYRRELTLGMVEANGKVVETLYQMAVSGRHPAATIFWAKARCGWREAGVDQEHILGAVIDAIRDQFSNEPHKVVDIANAIRARLAQRSG